MPEMSAEPLIGMRCVACRKDEPTVTDAEIADYRPQIPYWDIIEVDGIPQLRRSFRFAGFADRPE
jgi:4a-hydroxytetrahydrobiopterin dehydratase